MSILTDLRAECSERSIPFQATLELTYKCNERCGHCYLATYDDHADGRPVLDLGEWKRVLDELSKAGTLVLVFIGGEAMMHPHFWELAEHAARKGFALSLVTNGLKINDEAADKMARLGFYQVSVSLYSAEAAIHDRMTRRKGSWILSTSAIARLRARGIEVIVNCLLTSVNIDSCFELEDWGAERGVRVQFDPMVTAKNDGTLDSTVTRASREQLLAYYSRLAERGRRARPAPQGEADDPVCNAGRGKCAINMYGDLLSCLEVRDPIGNLRDASFAELWSSPKAESLRGLRNRELKFDASCGDGAYCDHCPGMAAAETGDRAQAVPFLMELAAIKRQVDEAEHRQTSI
jgi:radical SAM protein with 4Fe4S-binding SPASM domain